MKDVKVIKGAYSRSDHHLLLRKLQLKLRHQRTEQEVEEHPRSRYPWIEASKTILEHRTQLERMNHGSST